MIHIITEDEGAGFDFWVAVQDYIRHSNIQCEAITSKGAGKFFTKCCDLLSGKLEHIVSPGDTLYLALDCIFHQVADDVPDNAMDALSDIQYICKSRDVRVITPSYYCFEEILISFRCIETLINQDSKALSTVIKEVQSQLYTDTFDWTTKGNTLSSVPDILRFKTRRSSLGDTYFVTRNREQFLAFLLNQYTQGAKGRRVTVNKGSMGDCWIDSCSELQSLPDGVGSIPIRMCEGCCWNTYSLNSDKIVDIIENSILSQSENNTFITMLRDIKSSSDHIAAQTALFV